jgi:TetR/AcrR family transcriptional repressor of mexJK operon
MPETTPLPTAVAQAPGRPKDLEKRAAILEAAKDLFLARGFEATSMDAVAQAAGVSKLTVYNHFQDKDTLFLSAVKSKCEEQLPHQLFAGRLSGSVREQLLVIARAFHGLVTSAESVSVHRMIAAEGGRGDSHLGQLFYEAGPRRTLDEMQLFLEHARDEGLLEIADPGRAAGHFFCMIKGVGHMRMLCACEQPMTEAETRAHLESVVDLFLRAFAPR